MSLSKSLHQLFRVVGFGALCFVGLASVAVACLQIRGLPQRPAAGSQSQAEAKRDVRPPLPEGSYPKGPLPVGTVLPQMEAAGWINGTPGERKDRSERLVVLDIWSHWCPACRMTAPALVQLQKKFADRVSFVSLTNVDQQQVAMFAEQSQITWSCGYGASLEDLSQLGAYTTQWIREDFNPGYEVMPTIYLLGADGRVLWHDEQGRPKHLKQADEIVKDLEAELERQLAAES